MSTEILPPQNCIRKETLISSQSRSRINPNPNSTRSRRRKRSQSNITENINGRSSRKSQDRTVENRSGNKTLVMGEVKILKRGEKLDELKLGFRDEEEVLSSTDRLGPDPDTVMEQIRVFSDLYAGSQSMLASPPPSAVPFPAFFAKKEERFDEVASDLRRLLRLDMINLVESVMTK
ncbi:Cortactin-binding protein like [Heracleum sosnowskyi]|uniref:Cortactin-binding protein like n=1 Tax=Heracleum sosnowskyi TaxID=360622 RepID=A0AAD8N9W8_9APIA|nr:Cortactin-binding protein like [Heracleum sosnowskyi]